MSKDKTSEALNVAVGAIVIFTCLFLLIVGIVWYFVWAYGFVLTKLWLWFMVPTFGLPALSLPVAIGITMIVRFMCPKSIPKLEDFMKKDEETWITFLKFAMLFVLPWLTLLIGWIVSLFV